MKIASAASAFPSITTRRKFFSERLQDYWGPELKNPLLLARLHRNVTVDGRYLAIPAEQYVDIKTWGQANDIWIRVAQELGEKALCLALHNAGLEPSDLGCLFFTTVTGVASPSIDALLINRMGLPPNIRRTRSSDWDASPAPRELHAPRITFARIRSKPRLWFRSNFVHLRCSVKICRSPT